MTTREIFSGLLEGKKYTSSIWAEEDMVLYLEDTNRFVLLDVNEKRKPLKNWISIIKNPETFCEYIEPIGDKVACWADDGEDVSEKALVFYDVKNKQAFSYDGRRGSSGSTFDNYAPIENITEYPQDFQDMVMEMRTHLED